MLSDRSDIIVMVDERIEHNMTAWRKIVRIAYRQSHLVVGFTGTHPLAKKGEGKTRKHSVITSSTYNFVNR